MGLGSKTPPHERSIPLLLGCRIMVGSFVGSPLGRYVPFILVHMKDGKWSVCLSLSPTKECLVMTVSSKI